LDPPPLNKLPLKWSGVLNPGPIAFAVDLDFINDFAIRVLYKIREI
jgi:hypothetical protein